MRKRTAREWWIKSGDLRGAVVARHEFSRMLKKNPTSELARYDAALIFGELVANAVKCARTSVKVELIEDEWATLRVTDDGDCFDLSTLRPQPLYAQGGRGLYIVNQLARNLDVVSNHLRCEVTAVLPIRSQRWRAATIGPH